MDCSKIFGLEDKATWNEYLEKLPKERQDVYFTPQYYQLYEELGDGKAQCFIYEKNRELVLYPFLINSVNKLGFTLDAQYFDIQGAYSYNGVISNSDEPLFIQSFYNAFGEYCRINNIIAEFTRFHPVQDNVSFSKDNLTVIPNRVTVAIDLTKSYEDIWENEYSSKNRNKIRKAQKLGYKIEYLHKPNEQEIDSFIEIYTSRMRMVQSDSYYFFNRNYFLNIFRNFPGRAFLINVVDTNNDVVCSSIFLHYGDFFHYHLSGRTTKAVNSVNNFLIDRTVEFAQHSGAKLFHLGGGRTSAEEDSLFEFKKSFSKTTLPFYIGKKIHNPIIYKEVIDQWEAKFPMEKEQFKNLLLKYRY